VGDRLVTVITGASRGLGASVARLAATQGHDLVLVARDEELLGRVADECRALGATTEVAVADLLDAQTPARVLDPTLTPVGRIDGLEIYAGLNRTG